MLAKAVETFRPTSLPRYAAALAGAVVATDTASVDAGCDNGAGLHGEVRRRGGGAATDRRIE
jgi:hypothetical protein